MSKKKFPDADLGVAREAKRKLRNELRACNPTLINSAMFRAAGQYLAKLYPRIGLQPFFSCWQRMFFNYFCTEIRETQVDGRTLNCF